MRLGRIELNARQQINMQIEINAALFMCQMKIINQLHFFFQFSLLIGIGDDSIRFFPFLVFLDDVCLNIGYLKKTIQMENIE